MKNFHKAFLKKSKPIWKYGEQNSTVEKSEKLADLPTATVGAARG